MQFIVAFDWNGKGVVLADAPRGAGVVPVGAFIEAAEALTEYANGLPVQLAPLAEGGGPCQPPAEE